MTTVEDVSAETGTPTAEVLSTCRDLGIVASSAASGLSRHEHERLRAALGASPDLPPVEAGSTERTPDASPVPDDRDLRGRRDDLRAAARKGRIDGPRAVRYAIYAFLVLAVLLAVASLAGRDGEEVTTPASLTFSDTDEGACVDLDEGGGRQQVVIVGCEVPHDAELYEVVAVEADADDAFPGGEALLAEARTACGNRFVAYVGRPYAASMLDVVFLVPTPETWSLGDRSILCLVEDPSGPLVGSVRDIDR